MPTNTTNPASQLSTTAPATQGLLLRLGILTKLTFVLLAASMLVPSVHAANMIQNADFELLKANPTLTPSGKGGKASNLQFWTCGGPNGCALAYVLSPNTNGSAWNNDIGVWGTLPNSPTGGNFIAIDGDTRYLANISQTLNNLEIGRNYVVNFYMAAAQQRGTSGATTEWWDVSFGSQTQRTTVLSNPNRGVQPWRLQTMHFQATAVSQTLTFLAGGTPNGLPPISLLDGVLVTPNPEPGTVVLLGAGLGAVFYFRGKRR